MKVLMIPDGNLAGASLVSALSREGYEVDTASLPAVAARIRADAYGVIVVGAGTTDGPGVCADLRGRGVTTPIVVVGPAVARPASARTLDAGADLHMVDPIDVGEFLARVRALLRRAHGYTILRCGPLVFDRVGRRAVLDGSPLALTGREYSLLLYFALHEGEVVSRADIMSKAWNTRFGPCSNLAEVHVGRIRDKLGRHAWMVETVYGAGYRMRAVRR